jgi:hypothetical protein
MQMESGDLQLTPFAAPGGQGEAGAVLAGQR